MLTLSVRQVLRSRRLQLEVDADVKALPNLAWLVSRMRVIGAAVRLLKGLLLVLLVVVVASSTIASTRATVTSARYTSYVGFFFLAAFSCLEGLGHVPSMLEIISCGRQGLHGFRISLEILA